MCWEKYMTFNINNKVAFPDSFQSLSSSLDSLIKVLGKDGFKYLSQEFDSVILGLVKQKGFYPYEYINDFVKVQKTITKERKVL